MIICYLNKYKLHNLLYYSLFQKKYQITYETILIYSISLYLYLYYLVYISSLLQKIKNITICTNITSIFVLLTKIFDFIVS